MSSFGGTVKLNGESEYKQALKEIATNLKVLNSEMKAITSEYDSNDKSAENLSAQNEVLTKKIEEQQKKVGVLSEALENSKQETGENSDATKKWQIELNNAKADLNKMERQVKTNNETIEAATQATEDNSESTKDLAKDVEKAKKTVEDFNKKTEDNASSMDKAKKGTKEEADAVEKFGKEADKSGESALSLGDIIKANLISDVIKGGLTALVDGFKAMGEAMSGCLTEGAAYADTLITLSAQTGLSTDTLEKYNAVAELADVSMDTFTGSLAKTTKAMGEAQKGSTKYVEAYEKLGVSVTDANGNLRDSEEVYWETVDALKGIENETERDALAMELFGKSAQDLNTIIDMGSEGFQELEKTAENMGAVLGGEGLSALGALDDQMQIFASTTNSTKNILASAFAPAMSGALEGVNALGGAFNGLIAAVISGEGVDQAFYMVSEGLSDLIDGIGEALPQVMSVVGDLFNMILDLIAEYLPWLIEEGAAMLSSLLSGISQNIGTVMTTVTSIVNTLLTTIIQNLPVIIEMGINMLASLVQGIADSLPTLIPTVVDAVILMVETLLDNLDMLIDAGINLILSLADGLIEALPRLVDKIPVIIDKLLSAIFDNFPLILDAGIQLVIQLAGGLVKAIPQLIEQAPVLIAKIVKGLIEEIPQLIKAGGQLLAGLFEGLLNPKTIWNSVKSLFNGIISGVKELFGIHSPSKVFEDEVGKNLALGLGEGFEDTMSEVTNDMASAIPTEFDTDINANMNMASAKAGGSTYDMMVSAFKQALTEVKVVLDNREMGSFVTDTVERVVLA